MRKIYEADPILEDQNLKKAFFKKNFRGVFRGIESKKVWKIFEFGKSTCFLYLQSAILWMPFVFSKKLRIKKIKYEILIGFGDPKNTHKFFQTF